MTPVPARRRGVRPLHAIFMASVAFVAITCLNDRPSGPAGQARASLRLHSVARAPSACGPAPVIHPAKARVLLRQPGRADSMVFTGTFVNDTVTLNIEVPVSSTTELLDIDAQAIDALGDTVFRARDTVTAKEGDRTTVGYLQLWYSAPDSALAFLTILPRDTSVRFGGTLAMRSTGLDTHDATFTGTIRLSFLSRDPTIVATTAAGALTAQSKTGTTWVVATTWLGLCDSTSVTTIAPVATVTLTPDTIDIVRDGTVQIVAVLKDAAGNQLFNRPITWSSSNANASVDTTGSVKGLVKGAARITATSEGKSATAGIGVLAKPVAKVTIAPKPLIVNVAGTGTLTATAYDSANAANADWPVTWTSLRPAIATVSVLGVVTGVAPGTDTVTATAGGVADSVVVTVQTVGITSTVVTPTPDSLYSINDSLALTAKSYTGATLTAGTYGWVSRDPAVATVTTSGLVVAAGNGTTYVVATETGGTKDSARVTVAQRASAISLTPTPVQRYLGTTQTFVAAATDARGNAIAGAAFTWSVSDPSVASISSTGLATMLAVGIDTVKATIGAVVGKAFLTVRPVISRIAVTPAGVTLTALGNSQGYTGTAYDTLGVVMANVSFSWASSNPSVATVPGSNGVGQSATAVANGTTQIQATAQGVTGSVTLTVAQLLTSIVAGPTPTTIGQNGIAQLTARGKDANGYFIPGGTFTWLSNAPTLVTVGATTGIVTGVGTPPTTANITAASGGITSNIVLVNVDNSVPAHVSWGHDTLSIGRGSLNNSIPLYLSKPAVTPVTINVAARDTFAYFSPTSVTFAAGQTTANATLNGRNAGVTKIYATDAASIYTADSATLLVQASARLAPVGYGLNAGDYLASQVLLSDPAPAGGVYLTFSYSTAGVAQVSPDPAFVPAGQLAANINVTGIGAGTTIVTPGAPGVIGAPQTVSVAVAKLGFANPQKVLGAGQTDVNADYMYVQTNMVHPLVVTMANSDSSIAKSLSTFTILAQSNYVYFSISAFRAGIDTQTITASGYAPASRPVIVTTPHIGICCGTTLNTTSAVTTVSAYSEDSVKTAHNRTNPLFVTVSSSDPTIIKVIDTLVTIAAGSNGVSARYQPGGSGGTAYIRVSAGGHTSDSVLVTVTAPLLGISNATAYIGAEQQGTNFEYVYIPNAVAFGVPVSIVSSDSTILWAPSTATIAVGTNYAYFNVRAHRAGTATLTFTANGYSPITSTVIVSTPHLTNCCNSTLNNFVADQGITVYSTDSVGSTRAVNLPVPVTITNLSPTIVAADSTSVTILAGSSYNNLAHVKVKGVGVGRIVFTAPGYRPDTAVYTVVTPALSVSNPSVTLGLRQHAGVNGAYIAIPNSRPESVIVHVANTNTTVATFPDSLKIPAGNTTNYLYFDYSATGLGRDSIVYSAAGYNNTQSVVVVTRSQLHNNGVSSSYNTTSPPTSVSISTLDTVGTAHANLDAIAVFVRSSDTTVVKVDSTVVHIPVDRVTSFPAQFHFVGPGSARLYFTDSAGLYKSDSSSVMTVVGPVLAFAAGTAITNPITLGMRQHLGLNGVGTYVYVPNTVTGAPLVISLQSTDTTVLTVPATVTIPIGTNYVYFDVAARDTVGTVQVKATATGYGQAVSYVQVGRPRFQLSTGSSGTTTQAPGAVYVYAMDQTGVTRYTTENVAVTLKSTNPSVAATDSTVVVILKDNYANTNAKVQYLSAGTTLVGASDARSAFYRYDSAASVPVQVNNPTVCLGLGCAAVTTLGLSQYIDTYAYIPNSLATPLTVTLSSTTGATSAPATVTIPAGNTSVSVRLSAVSRGGDVILTSAPGFTGGAVTVAVDSDVVAPVIWPSALLVGDSVPVQFYVYDAAGNARPLISAVSFTFTPSSNISMRDASGNVITSVTVPVAAYLSPVFYIHGTAAGTAQLSISSAISKTYTNIFTVQ